jgi:hypothetical protein
VAHIVGEPSRNDSDRLLLSSSFVDHDGRRAPAAVVRSGAHDRRAHDLGVEERHGRGLDDRDPLDDGSTPGVFVNESTTNLRLRSLNVLGLGPAIYVADLSEVSMAKLTVRTGGWGAVGIWHSKVSLEDSLLQNPEDDYQSGIQVTRTASC